MAITVYPLNNINYAAEDVGIYNATRTSGIYANDDFALSLTGSDNTISVDVGLAWMHISRFFGVAVALKNKIFVDMGLPDSVYSRIDALVLQFDANKNGADVVVKSGTASSKPQPPARSQTEALYELHLAHVLRKPGAASITAGDVTDLRLNSTYCGLMADAVTKVDTEAINAQVSALIAKLRDDLQKVEENDYYASKDYVEKKVDKSNVVNNFTTTEEGFVADARALKVLNDNKTSIELVWENKLPENELGKYTYYIPEIGDAAFLDIELRLSTTNSYTVTQRVSVGNIVNCMSDNNNGKLSTRVIGTSKDTMAVGGGYAYNTYGSYTSNDAVLIPVRAYAIRGG